MNRRRQEPSLGTALVVVALVVIFWLAIVLGLIAAVMLLARAIF